MKTWKWAVIAIVLAAQSAAFAQTTPFNSAKDRPWYEGFEPVQKLITAASYGGGLETAFRTINYQVATLSFRVDSALMRREWETLTLADGQIQWTTRTRLVYSYSNRPLWELMEHIAKVLDAHWEVDKDVCTLAANPEPKAGLGAPAPGKLEAMLQKPMKKAVPPISLASASLAGAFAAGT